LLPPEPKPDLTTDFLGTLGLKDEPNKDPKQKKGRSPTDAIASYLEQLLEEDDDEEDDQQGQQDVEDAEMRDDDAADDDDAAAKDEKATKASNPLLAIVDEGDAENSDAKRCRAALGAALEFASATPSHAAAALDAVAPALGQLSRGDDACEAACIDAVAAVWRDSPFHVEFLVDGLVRRGVLRPRAIVAWLFETESSYGVRHLEETHRAARLLDVAVDRSLDLLAAATARGDPELLDAQLDEAKAVASTLFAKVAEELAAFVQHPVDVDTDTYDERKNWKDVALAVLKDIVRRCRRAELAQLEAHRRSSTCRALPRVLDKDDLNLPDLHEQDQRMIEACFD